MPFEVWKDKKGEYRWRLKAKNGQTIASSGEGYKDKRNCMSGIEAVKKASNDEVKDVEV